MVLKTDFPKNFTQAVYLHSWTTKWFNASSGNQTFKARARIQNLFSALIDLRLNVKYFEQKLNCYFMNKTSFH